MESKESLRCWLSEALLYPVDSETIFFDDLGLAGIDLETFILKFMEKYEIDPADFNLQDYVPGGVNLFKRTKIKSLNLDHLYAVVEKGVWFDPF
ncbi:DUF1493 family protein [bacterium SCSIO 12741]|nr:DUF1493 family protein [bacterium SCSIO 12741]